MKLAHISPETTKIRDIYAIVLNEGEVKATKEKGISYRTVTICDASLIKLNLCLWGPRARSFNYPSGSAIFINSGYIRNFNGFWQLNIYDNTHIGLALFSEHSTQVLLQWWKNSGKDSSFEFPCEVKSLEDAISELAKLEGGRYYFETTGKVKIEDESISYKSCPVCLKAVKKIGETTLFCEKCDKTTKEPNFTYILSVIVRDEKAKISMKAFGSVGEEILGISVHELLKLEVYILLSFFFFLFEVLIFCLQEKDKSEYKSVFKKAERFIYTIRCSAGYQKGDNHGEMTFNIHKVVSKKERDPSDVVDEEEDTLEEGDEEEEEEEK